VDGNLRAATAMPTYVSRAPTFFRSPLKGTRRRVARCGVVQHGRGRTNPFRKEGSDTHVGRAPSAAASILTARVPFGWSPRPLCGPPPRRHHEQLSSRHTRDVQYRRLGIALSTLCARSALPLHCDINSVPVLGWEPKEQRGTPAALDRRGAQGAVASNKWTVGAPSPPGV